LASYIHRLLLLMRSRKYDLIWIEYEIFPWFPAWIEGLLSLAGVPVLVDFDDAVFHKYDLHENRFVRGLLGKKIDNVMRRATIVVAGNEYIAARARNAGCKRVEILPTVVDLERYSASGSNHKQPFTIGWIGSPVTSHYLMEISDSLKKVCAENDARVVLIGSGEEYLGDTPVERRPWSEEREVRDIHSFDVGIMPLSDTPWDRGKCGYKLIQYMACGKPVVASPVGANVEIVEHGTNGFLAADQKDWVHALKTLSSDPELCRNMGLSGRKKVEDRYCLQVTAPRLLGLLHEAVEG